MPDQTLGTNESAAAFLTRFLSGVNAALSPLYKLFLDLHILYALELPALRPSLYPIYSLHSRETAIHKQFRYRDVAAVVGCENMFLAVLVSLWSTLRRRPEPLPLIERGSPVANFLIQLLTGRQRPTAVKSHPTSLPSVPALR